MSLTLTQPCIADFAVLAHTMRPDEIEQFMAFSGQEKYDAEIAAAGFIAVPGPKFALIDANKRAVLAGGFVPLSRGVYEAWLCGPLSSWENHWREITTNCRRVIGFMLEGDAHRVQIICLASRIKAGEWYQRGLGLEFEGTLRRYTATGDDALVYAKVREM